LFLQRYWKFRMVPKPAPPAPAPTPFSPAGLVARIRAALFALRDHRKGGQQGLLEELLVGYVSQYLDGIWLRARYLHNGSVPTLRDLLKPVDERRGDGQYRVVSKARTGGKEFEIEALDRMAFVLRPDDVSRNGAKHRIKSLPPGGRFDGT
jgi:hypothetical protein